MVKLFQILPLTLLYVVPQLYAAVEYNNPSSTTGGPCVFVEGESEEQYTQKGVYRHKVKAKNSCNEKMRVKVCYQSSTTCIGFSVSGGGLYNGVLGVKRGQPDFRFSYEWGGITY